MSARIRAIFVFFLLFSAIISQAQQKWPSSLLWKISGHGLEKPSYLFGTMHLQDKRLFNFKDSLYSFLEKAEGFAVEVNFPELMDSVLARTLHEEEEKFLKGDEVEVDTKKLGKDADSLLKVMGIKEKKLNRVQLKKIRDYRMSRLLVQGEMPTIVDAYLYGLALRQNKWLGGIEDIQDQLELRDELGGELKAEDVLQSEAGLRLSLDRMMKIYIAEDLDALSNFVYSYAESEMGDKILTKRNIKMARRMDSLSAIRTMFFAVGAAHLPGESGVIELLRKKGFTVEPVFSSRRMAAEEYSKKIEAAPWHLIKDENKLYTVEMPGVASDHKLFGEAFKLKMFFDITTMTFYFAGNTIAANMGAKGLDDMLADMITSMKGEHGKLLSKKKDQPPGT